MKIVEIQSKSILTKSKLPDTDYVVNPYTGCQFGCLYCYASFMGRFVNEALDDWGNYVYVKSNAVKLFEREIERLIRQHQPPSILLSSVTDPYQGCEKKYELTRGILQVLEKRSYQGLVGILTKSPLVSRDIDVIANLANAEVGVTVTETDDEMSRFLEVRAPLASSRLKTLQKLNEANVTTYAFVGPLLPHFRFSPEDLEGLIQAISKTGTKSLYIEHINLKRYIHKKLDNEFPATDESVREVYRNAKSGDHRQILENLILPLVEKYGLRLRLNKILLH